MPEWCTALPQLQGMEVKSHRQGITTKTPIICTYLLQ